MTDPRTLAVRATQRMLAAEAEARRQRGIRAVHLWDAKHAGTPPEPSSRSLSRDLQQHLLDLGYDPQVVKRAGLGWDSIRNVVEGPRPDTPT